MESRIFGRQLTNLADQEQLRAKRNYSFLHNDRPKVPQLPLSAQKHNMLMPTPKELNQKGISSDPQMVPEYFEQNFAFIRSLEATTYSGCNYLEGHKTVNQAARAKLIDWLIQLHYKYKMFPETIFTAVSYIDRYLSMKPVHLSELQLVGIAALLIAAKFEETYQVPRISQLVSACSGQYTTKNLLKMESDMLNAFNFQLISNSSLKFYEPLAKKTELSPKNVHLGQYILELALTRARFLAYPPSLLACATIYLVKKIRKTQNPWNENLSKLMGYKENELKSCGKQLCTLLQQAPTLENCNALKKKYSLTAFHEVAKIKIERKK